MAEVSTADLAYALIRGGDQPPDFVELRMIQCVIKKTYDWGFVYPWPEGVPFDDPNTFYRGVDRVDISLTEQPEYTIQGVPVYSNYKPVEGDTAWVLINDADLVVVDRVGELGPGLFTRTVRGVTVSPSNKVWFGLDWPAPSTDPATIPEGQVNTGFTVVNAVTAVMSNSGSYMVGFTATMKIVAAALETQASEHGLVLCHLLTTSPGYPDGTQYELRDPANMNIAFHGAVNSQGRFTKVWMGEGLGPGTHQFSILGKVGTPAGQAVNGQILQSELWVIPL